MEVEDREEQDLVLLTEVPCQKEKAVAPDVPPTPTKKKRQDPMMAAPSPAKSTASTKIGVSMDEEDQVYPFGMESFDDSSDDDDDDEVIPKVSPGEPLAEVLPGIIKKMEAAENLSELEEDARRDKKRKMLCLLLLLILIGIGVAVGVVLAKKPSDEEPKVITSTTTTTEEDESTLSPSTAPVDPLQDTLARLFVNPSRYPTEDDESPSWRAVLFLTTEHENLKDRDTSHLGQRYALINMYYSLGGADWIDDLGFLDTSRHECDWNALTNGLIKGVICENNDNVVTYISIPNNNLAGSIPQHVGYLSRVYHFDLSFNKIGGIIPQGLIAASGMERLSLNSNQLTGSVPSFLMTSYKDLRYLAIEDNLLTGDLDRLCENESSAVLKADCLGTNPEVTCACCNFCCDRDDLCQAV